MKQKPPRRREQTCPAGHRFDPWSASGEHARCAPPAPSVWRLRARDVIGILVLVPLAGLALKACL